MIKLPTRFKVLPFHQTLNAGFTLAEVLISLVLIGLLFIPMFMTAGKSKANSSGLGYQRQLAMEVNQAIENLTKELEQAHTIQSTSYNQKLFCETVDIHTNTFTNSIWRISPMSGANRLEYSPDNGSTYYSPYPLSNTTSYTLTSGDILYCGDENNCTVFQDTNANGVYGAGDAAGTLASGYTGTALTSPANATRIVLRNWVFNRSNAYNALQFNLPDMFIRLPERGYGSSNNNTVTISSFSTVNGSFPAASAFDVADVAFHAPSKQLFVVGETNVIYRVNNDSVFIGPPVTVSNISTAKFTSISAEADPSILWTLDSTAKKIYKVPVSEWGSTATGQLLDDFYYSSLTSIRSIAVNEGISGSIFIVALNGTNPQLLQLNSASGAIQATWNLPAGLNNPGGAEIDPISGDVLIWNQTVSSNVATLYRIRLGTAPSVTSTTTSYNLLNIDSTNISNGTRYFGLGLDVNKNRFYLSDPGPNGKDKIYYVMSQNTLARSL
jgi:prepilin-type N-terminal cleavage/methylation domain-containing protein